MSQLSMSLPGGGGRSRPSPNVYTALFVAAFVSLAAAAGFLYWAGTKVAPDGQPWQIQDSNRIQLPSGR